MSGLDLWKRVLSRTTVEEDRLGRKLKRQAEQAAAAIPTGDHWA